VIVSVAVWVLAAGFGLWALIRVTGLERGTPLIQLVSFTPYAVPGALLTALLGAVTARWAAAAVAAGAFVALTAAVLPRVVPGPRPPAGPTLRVMASNLLNGGADARVVVEHVKVDDIEVLALVELTPEAVEALDAAGIAELLPYRVVHATGRYQGSGLLSRRPLSDPVRRRHPCGATQTSARLTVPGAAPDIVIEAAHPCAPNTFDTACWEADLRAQPPATPDGPISVVLGDFNATLDHASLRRFLRTGYHDAAALLGRGLAPTWPFKVYVMPWITIDHVFLDRRAGVARYGTRPIPDTDHKAVFAELVLPAAGRDA
jgi:endonuclease/exonuclease/phosphatase family metal-dependent hydrolase